MKSGINHVTYYFVELFVLLLGFYLVFTFSSTFLYQLLILMAVLIAYIFIGIMHHHANHDLRRKISFEYILISAIILGAFLFLNANRL